MNRIKALTCLLFILLGREVHTRAQQRGFSVAGKITDLVTGKPLPAAVVFIAGSSMGDVSTADGSYRIAGLAPGKYDLVVSLVGYKMIDYEFSMGQGDVRVEFEMVLSPENLSQITISAKSHRNRDLQLFRKNFLGQDFDASLTRILNENILQLRYSAAGVLTAKASQLLTIQNEALGYIIHFRLDTFRFDTRTGYLSYKGFSYFTPLDSVKRPRERYWKKNRDQAYQGSELQFFRQLISRSVDGSNFRVGLIQPDDGKIHPGDLNIRFDGEAAFVNYWDSLPYDQLLNQQAATGNFRLSFSGTLGVVWLDEDYGSKSRQVSLIRLASPWVTIDRSGSPESGSNIDLQGYWMTRRVADLLPVDYYPDQEEATE